jgi:hypothetical protein
MGCGTSKGAIPHEQVRLDNKKPPEGNKLPGDTQQQPPNKKPDAAIPDPKLSPGGAEHDGAKVLLPGATTGGAGQDGTTPPVSEATPTTETSLKRYQNPRVEVKKPSVSSEKRVNRDTKSSAVDSTRLQRRQKVTNQQVQAGIYTGETLNGIQVCFLKGLTRSACHSSAVCFVFVSVFLSPLWTCLSEFSCLQDGVGEMMYSRNGERYEGGWKEGYRHGTGTLR